MISGSEQQSGDAAGDPAEEQSLTAQGADAGAEGGNGGRGLRAHAPDPDDEPIESPRERWARVLPSQWMVNYCVALQKHGVVGIALEKAGCSRSSVSRWRQAVPVFDLCIREALEDSVDAIETSARQSAIEGDEEPIFQGGVHVGTKLVKSVKAMELLLRAKRPHEYRPEQAGGQGGISIILPSAEAVMDAVRSALPGLEGLPGVPALLAKPVEAQPVEQPQT